MKSEALSHIFFSVNPCSLVRAGEADAREKVPLCRRFAGPLLMVAILTWDLSAGCARPASGPSPVSHQTFTTRFTGYRIVYMLKAAPSEVEEYLREPQNLVSDSGAVQIVYLSGDRMQGLGDRAEFAIRTEFAGNVLPYKLLLIHQRRSEELWYLSEGERGKGLSVLRFRFKELNRSTKVTLTFEKQEEQEPVFRSLTEALNLSETIVRTADLEGARMQAHFDPSLRRESLLEKGCRGELYNKFYQGHRFTVLIQAAPERVYQYLSGLEFAELEREANFDFNRCFLSSDLSPFLSRLRLMGADYEIDTLPGLRRSEEGYYSCYLVPQALNFVSRSQLSLQPRQDGTELSISYITETPESAASELVNLAVLLDEIPETIEQLLIRIKEGAEKTQAEPTGDASPDQPLESVFSVP